MNVQPKILMILTSHRLDCLTLCIDMLVQGGSAKRFDRICILGSGITGRHRAYVESLPQRFPDIRWDFFHGPRGRGKPISDLQNACVRKYPHALYFKLDEDTFVSEDWDLEMTAVYEAHRHDTRLSLLTAVVTNNQRGAYHLLHRFPELGETFKKRFLAPITAERMGPVWHRPDCAAFMMRSFMNLRESNRRLREGSAASHETFTYPFSINCIAYDYRHWEEIGGVPEHDESGWGSWITQQGKIIVLATRALVHHYAFFVQQEWLDRTTLLEEIRQSNVAPFSPLSAGAARLGRIVRQVPSIIRRRLAKSPS